MRDGYTISDGDYLAITDALRAIRYARLGGADESERTLLVELEQAVMDALAIAESEVAAVTLERCVCGECYWCPDGYHDHADLPCSCTPDCAAGSTCESCGDLYDETRGDGYCGLCPSCADATDPPEEG